jgi:hypothetical protein
MKRILGVMGAGGLILAAVLAGHFGLTRAQIAALPVVTAASFGVVCDGSTDDAGNMQTAITNSAGAHEILQLPQNKTCLIGTQLNMPSNTFIEGQGFGSVLKFNWVNNSAGGGSHYLAAQPGDDNVTLTNFTVNGASNGVPSGMDSQNTGNSKPMAAVRFTSCTNSTVDGIQIENNTGVGLSYQDCQHMLIENNSVHNTGRDGITGFISVAPTLSYITVTGNTISNVGDDSIAFDVSRTGSAPPGLATHITVTNNAITGWGTNPSTAPNNGSTCTGGCQLGRGIALNGVNGAVVMGNTLANTYDDGILMSGCTVSWCGAANAPGCTMPCNSFPDTNIVVKGNTFTNIGNALAGSSEGGTKSFGIDVFNGAAPITVASNQVSVASNNTLGGILDPGFTCTGGCSIQSTSGATPGTPAGVSFAKSGSHCVLTWSPPAGSVTGYVVLVTDSQGGSSTQIVTSPNTSFHGPTGVVYSAAVAALTADSVGVPTSSVTCTQ